MNVVAFSGYSGSGKTTLIEQLIPQLTALGLRVSVIKHAHHRFDIDHPGKDSWRHREAGAREVLVVSDRRMALMREFDPPREADVHGLIAELDARSDWVLVEGFRHSDLPKIEVWRASATDRAGRPHGIGYPHDAQVAALCTDSAASLPQACELPLLSPDDAPGVAAWLLKQSSRFHYEVRSHV